LFVGAFERQLDDKGRLALPAPFRVRLGEHCYLAKGPDKSVHVVPAETFEAEAAAMTARVLAGEVSRNELRALASSASLVTLDKQGRVNVDDALRTYADLHTESAVVVAGSFDRLEIWAPSRFARIDTAGTADLAGPETAASAVE
jgi:MraZ protein